jgi:hypothetical protein
MVITVYLLVVPVAQASGIGGCVCCIFLTIIINIAIKNSKGKNSWKVGVRL